MKRPMTMMILTLLLTGLSCTGTNSPNGPVKDVKAVTVEVTAGAKNDEEKIRRIFLFVRDRIDFNWIYPQDLPSGIVLANGYGVCMQKAHLLSDMARAAGFETRFRFVFVRKQALEDFLPGYAWENWIDPFPHTVTEIRINGKWVSFDPSFDRQLYDLCLKKGINFARYPEIREAYTNDFSITGMKGTQEFWVDPERDPFYGETLEPLLVWDKENVPGIKRAFKPRIFRDAKKIMDRLRQT
jgi:transglutaminase-like putative cysteine protease